MVEGKGEDGQRLKRQHADISRGCATPSLPRAKRKGRAERPACVQACMQAVGVPKYFLAHQVPGVDVAVVEQAEGGACEVVAALRLALHLHPVACGAQEDRRRWFSMQGARCEAVQAHLKGSRAWAAGQAPRVRQVTRDHGVALTRTVPGPGACRPLRRCAG